MNYDKIISILEQVDALTQAERELLLSELSGKYGEASPCDNPGVCASDLDLDGKWAREYDVVLTGLIGDRPSLIKALQKVLGITLPQAKAVTDRLPAVICRSLSSDKAMELQEELQAAGGQVELRGSAAGLFPLLSSVSKGLGGQSLFSPPRDRQQAGEAHPKNRRKRFCRTKKRVIANINYIMAVNHDGMPISVCDADYDMLSVPGWKDLVALADDGGDLVFIVGLRSDGRVMLSGIDEDDDRYAAAQWEDVIDIAANRYSIFGLRSDGTVVRVSDSTLEHDECEMEGWADIIAIVAGGLGNNLFGLKSDGTVVGAGSCLRFGEGWTKWRDIVSITPFETGLIGVTAQGKALCSEDNEPVASIVSSWDDLTDIAVGDSFVAGLRKNGSIVVATLDGETVDDFPIQNGVALVSGDCFLLVLTADGSVWGIDIGDDEMECPLEEQGLEGFHSWKLWSDLDALL